MSKNVAVGIDLGTTRSCVAVYTNGKVHIIEDETGNRITPSCVAFTNERVLIGSTAVNQADTNPRNTIFDAKRIVGRKFADPILEGDVSRWPFEVFDSDGAPKYKVQYKSEQKLMTPEAILALVLGNMKALAEAFVNEVVLDAVISVPAYYNNSQRRATKEAGEIAGLNVLKIINEPTAAVIAYWYGIKVDTVHNVMIYDLGGGTLDVSVASISKDLIEVKAVGGNTHHGGGDFDERLVKHFLEIIYDVHKVDLSHNKTALIRLNKACKSAKHDLSSSLNATVDIPNFFDGKDFRSCISRTLFELLCSDLFQQTMEHVSSTLDDSGLNKEDIHELVLVGDSTKIPKIQQLLEGFLGSELLNKTINPDEAVVYGAAIMAAILNGDNTVKRVNVFDVTPISLSVMQPDGAGTPVIKRNSKIPAKVDVIRTTVCDYQTRVRFKIFEGEDTCCENNNLLCTFDLDNIQRAPATVPTFKLKFEIDENGIFHASAMDLKTFCANIVTTTSKKGSRDRVEIMRMIAEAAEFHREFTRRNCALRKLQKYCSDTIRFVNEAGDGSSNTLREALRNKCVDMLEWADHHSDAEEQVQVKNLDLIREFCEPKLVSLQLSVIRHRSQILRNLWD